MKTLKTFTHKGTLLALIWVLGITACVESDKDPIESIPGTLEANVDRTAIVAGESVKFTDNSTKVFARTWSFPGGNPATSSEAEVIVNYDKGGAYLAALEVTYIDNLTETKSFEIEVEGLPEPMLEGLAIYSENEGLDQSVSIVFQSNNQFKIEEIQAGVFEGSNALAFTIDGSSDWAMGTVSPESGTVDISGFSEGFYNVTLKSTSNGDILLRLQSAGQNAVIPLKAADESYGFKRDGEWHSISIPMVDFLENNPGLKLNEINALLVFRSEGDVRNSNNYDFFLDNFYLSK